MLGHDFRINEQGVWKLAFCVNPTDGRGQSENP